jgi:uncharacterized protein YueI
MSKPIIPQEGVRDIKPDEGQEIKGTVRPRVVVKAPQGKPNL